MIPKEIVLDYAEKSGFGGIQRASILPRLKKFAEMISEYQKHRCADMCIDLGDKFKVKNTEFSDGQMDGAYQCSEVMRYENS
jgi:hypothetical protein